jgi:hypothetical protein
MGHNLTFAFEKNIYIQYGGSKMAAKNVYPEKMKSLLLYDDLTWSGVILRNVEKSMGGHLKLPLYTFSNKR